MLTCVQSADFDHRDFGRLPDPHGKTTKPNAPRNDQMPIFDHVVAVGEF